MTVLNRFRLDDQTAIVTGGNRGIGRAIATGFAEVGADVVVASRDGESGCEAAEETTAATDAATLAVETDVTDERSVEAMVEAALDEFGDVDILVNNADIVHLNAVEDKSVAEWAEYGMRVNNINPGYVDTGVLVDDQSVIDVWKSEMLVPEFATPADIVPLAVSLASDAASYVTGESVVIDGGYTVR